MFINNSKDSKHRFPIGATSIPQLVFSYSWRLQKQQLKREELRGKTPLKKFHCSTCSNRCFLPLGLDWIRLRSVCMCFAATRGLFWTLRVSIYTVWAPGLRNTLKMHFGLPNAKPSSRRYHWCSQPYLFLLLRLFPLRFQLIGTYNNKLPNRIIIDENKHKITNSYLNPELALSLRF